MMGLLVVDLQNDFVSGSLPVPGAYDAISLINRYLERRLLTGHGRERFVIASRDEHVDPGEHFKTYPQHCVKGTPGADFVPGFHDDLVDVIVRKGAHGADPSPFDGITDDGKTLEQVLRDQDITELEVCGLATDVCVYAGVMDAIRLGFQPILLVSLTAAIGGNQGMTDSVQDMIEHGAWVR